MWSDLLYLLFHSHSTTHLLSLNIFLGCMTQQGLKQVLPEQVEKKLIRFLKGDSVHLTCSCCTLLLVSITASMTEEETIPKLYLLWEDLKLWWRQTVVDKVKLSMQTPLKPLKTILHIRKIIFSRKMNKFAIHIGEFCPFSSISLSLCVS